MSQQKSEETKKSGLPNQNEPNASIASPSLPVAAPADEPGNKKQRVTESGPSMTAHVIIVSAGECITSEIVALSQHLGSNICVMAAVGEISRIKLRLPSNDCVTYEGRFMIQSFSGSLLLFDGGSGPSGRCGGINVSFFGPTGQLVGGAAAGEMIAASFVQIVLLSFPGEFCNVSKEAIETSAPPKVDEPMI